MLLLCLAHWLATLRLKMAGRVLQQQSWPLLLLGPPSPDLVVPPACSVCQKFHKKTCSCNALLTNSVTMHVHAWWLLHEHLALTLCMNMHSVCVMAHAATSGMMALLHWAHLGCAISGLRELATEHMQKKLVGPTTRVEERRHRCSYAMTALLAWSCKESSWLFTCLHVSWSSFCLMTWLTAEQHASKPTSCLAIILTWVAWLTFFSFSLCPPSEALHLLLLQVACLHGLVCNNKEPHTTASKKALQQAWLALMVSLSRGRGRFCKHQQHHYLMVIFMIPGHGHLH